jgi:hypothetical protein
MERLVFRACRHGRVDNLVGLLDLDPVLVDSRNKASGIYRLA